MTKNVLEIQSIRRLKGVLYGAVQGVGFRPFVYHLAVELGLKGRVSNSAQGVVIEAEGPSALLETFLLRLEREKPSRSFIQSLESSILDPRGFTDFQIIESSHTGERSALILPDIAACEACVVEMFDPSDRRYLYPFINCTHCGPRYSIIESLPYDRSHTSMKGFTMCQACLEEYQNPESRRYHAQANACPECGPQLEWRNCGGESLAAGAEAFVEAAHAILDGKIVAVKGLGGFHLMADATNDKAVRELRARKHREEKPLAVMMPSVRSVEEYCEVSALEARLLRSPEAPIVLLHKKFQRIPQKNSLAPSIAPGNPALGVILPYTPLHHLLLRKIDGPVVATSGNLSEEPIATDNEEALERLRDLVDFFLIHDRPIVRHMDDSIVRVMMGRQSVLRRARGFAPLPVASGVKGPSLLAVGAHLKNTIAQSGGENIFISQHIGDLESGQTYEAFQKTIKTFSDLYEQRPEIIACDLHPNYLSTKFAEKYGKPLIRVQHHYAHILSCMAENGIEAPALGVAWDGTGFGIDGSVWGGEFLRIDEQAFSRVSSFRRFHLPGGEKAVREPRRSALAVCFEVFGDEVFHGRSKIGLMENFSKEEAAILSKMLKGGIRSPWTSSAGRLFDAVASLLGLRQINRFEGQAAMELEFALESYYTDESYEAPLEETTGDNGDLLVFNWEPAVRGILLDRQQGSSNGLISAKFHNTLVEAIIGIAKHVGEEKVVLSGGCFQNRYLLERAVQRLNDEGFLPYWHQRVATNDGGIALGQIMAARRFLKLEDTQGLKRCV